MEDRGGVKGPVRVAEELTSEQDEVGLTGANDLIRLGWFGDHSDGSGGDLGLAVDGLGVVDLVAGADWDLLGGVVATGGDVYEIDICLLEEFGEGDGLGEVPACAEGLGSPVGGGDADEKRQVLGPGGADGFDDFEGEASAVFEAAAVFVGAVVGERREELVQEVAVGGVYLDEVEAGGEGAMGCCDEVGDDLVHAGAIECGGEGVGLVEADGGGGDGLPAAFGGGNGAGWLPWDGHAGFAACVG